MTYAASAGYVNNVPESQVIDELRVHLTNSSAALKAALADIEALRSGLWECARWAGADLDGDTHHSMKRGLIDFAVSSVKEMRECYDVALEYVPISPKTPTPNPRSPHGMRGTR